MRLRAPVTRIEDSGGGVRVTYRGGATTADYAVVAAPLRPLRDVAFSPALPGVMQDAIARLAYGTGTKALLQYSRRTWRRRGFDGDLSSDLPLSTTWEATEQQGGRAGILLAYTVGAPGARFVSLPAADRIAEVAAGLETTFPGSRRLLGRAVTVAWPSEPYTRGTYTAYAPGQVTAFWDAIRRPRGRLHFAGEHTDAFTAYMEGAARSGVRAAREVDARA